MAKNTRPNKSSFGKRSDAEKSFRGNRGSSRSGRGERFESDRPKKSFSAGRPSRFDKPDGEKKTYKRSGDSSSEKPRDFSKPFEKREGSDERPRSFSKSPYQKREGSFDSERPKRFSKPFEKREGGDEQPRSFSKSPYQKREGSFDSERPKRFSKPFEKREGGDERPRGFSKSPYQKREGSSDLERPKRFSASGFSNGEKGEKKTFGRKESSGGDQDRPKRIETEDNERTFGRKNFGDERPKRLSDSESTDSEEKPIRKPFGKTRESFSEAPVRKFSKEDIVKKASAGEGKSFTEPKKESSSTKNFTEDKKTEIRPAYQEKQPKGEGIIRLNRFIANSGMGSRRQADEYIKMGLVTVNGETVTEMGHKVKMSDDVRYEGKRLKAEKPVYILLNKPKGFITTTDDPQERNTVMNLVANAGPERIYPVGRLDRNTTGLLLLTNDGDLTDKLTHPSYKAKKVYKAELDKPITKADFQKIQEGGVYLEEGRAIVDELAMVSDDKKTIGIELHIGWNRIVRRIFESLGYEVVKLDRVVYAGLDKKDLSRGQWRFLKPEEVINLKHLNK